MCRNKDTRQEEFARLVREGPVSYIFRTEQALSIMNVTGELSKGINANNYGEVFSTFQSFCIEQFVLSITKMYESPRRYSLKSIPSVLEYFRKNATEIEVRELILLSKQLSRIGFDTDGFDDLTRVEQNTLVYEELARRLPRVEDNETLAALKAMRDKQIAHPEDIEIEVIAKTTWKKAEALLEYPKDLVGVLGDGYLSTAYMLEDGEYLLSYDAMRVGTGTRRMLKNLGITSEG